MKRIFAWIFILTLLATACDKDDAPTLFSSFDIAQFELNRELWNQNKPLNYSYESSYGFYFYNKVVFKNGQLDTIYSLKEQTGMQLFDTLTIERLFQNVEENYINAQTQKHKSDEVYLKDIEIAYDPIYHFPNSVYYVNHVPEGICIDGLFSFAIRNFTVEE